MRIRIQSFRSRSSLLQRIIRHGASGYVPRERLDVSRVLQLVRLFHDALHRGVGVGERCGKSEHGDAMLLVGISRRIRASLST